MLIVSLPDTEWADFEQASTPNLDRLFAQSAVGAMVTNGVDRPTSLPSGYVTVGRRRACGGQRRRPATRASASTRTSVATAPVSCSPPAPASPPGDGLVYMPIADTIEANDDELFGAEPGLLGDELATAGIAPRGDHQRRRHRSEHARHPVPRRGGAPRSPR